MKSCPLTDAFTATVPSGSQIVVAVSGGIDSVALLHLSVLLAPGLGLSVAVAHINHGLRAASAGEEQFVRDLADQYGVPVYVRQLTAPEGGNIESWARGQRYDFFKEILRRYDLDWVLTAHHANDVAETLLMRLLSNKEPRSILREDPVRSCLRPLLDVSRHDVQQFADSHKLDFREDESNQDIRYLRNMVRLELIPHLQKLFHKNVDSLLAHRAVCIAEDISALYSIAEQECHRFSKYEWGSREWLTSVRRELASQPEPVRWRMVELLMRSHIDFQLGRKKSREVCRVIGGEQVAAELPTGIRVSRSSGVLSVNKCR